MKDLVAAGLLPAGAVLTARHKGQTFEAHVYEDGTIEAVVHGEWVSGSPSAVGKAAFGYEVNGWIFWSYTDQAGRPFTLADLRSQLS